MIRWMIALVALVLAEPVWAADKDPCGINNVCASAPETVAKALQNAGFRAKITTDKVGDPKIESAAGGYNFDVLFFGCEAHLKCESLEFSMGLTTDARYTAELANDWNKDKRFGAASVNDKKEFWLQYDVTTLGGGLPAKNFADVIDWYQDRLTELYKFMEKLPAKK